MIKNKKKIIAVVTGSSSGIGLETSLLLARNGFHTFATMRNLDKSNALLELKQKEQLPLEVLHLDVTDDESVKEAIGKIINEQHRIDILVNNAGYGLVGPLEETSIEEIKEQFETNVFGAITVIQQVLPIMRKQGTGNIVNVSSDSWPNRLSSYFWICYSKFALEGLSESLAYEIEQFGIKVVIIEPGVIKTNFDNNLKTAKKVTDNTYYNSPYSEITQKRLSGFKPRFENGTPSIEVAKVILGAIRSENPKLRHIVGDDAFKIMEIRKNTSDREFREVVTKGVLK